jgi:hypothetical protein
MAVDLKQSHRRLLEEAYGKGNLAVFDEVCAPGYRGHDPLLGDVDVAAARGSCAMYRAAFPDLTPTFLGSFVDGDNVITHWRMTGTHRGALMGIEPTGKRCTAEGISIGKFKGGKIAEEWTQWDALGLLRQLGAAPELRAEPRPGQAASEQRPH